MSRSYTVCICDVIVLINNWGWSAAFSLDVKMGGGVFKIQGVE